MGLIIAGTPIVQILRQFLGTARARVNFSARFCVQQGIWMPSAAHPASLSVSQTLIGGPRVLQSILDGCKRTHHAGVRIAEAVVDSYKLISHEAILRERRTGRRQVNPCYRYSNHWRSSWLNI